MLEFNKSYWFLRGLGPQFSGFSDVCMTISHTPSFRDFAHQVRNYKLFHQSLESNLPGRAIFFATIHLMVVDLVLPGLDIIMVVAPALEVVVVIIPQTISNLTDCDAKFVAVSIMRINTSKRYA
ncbi:hypothetical protein ACS0TY_033413 [Phlomoides rotata]